MAIDDCGKIDAIRCGHFPGKDEAYTWMLVLQAMILEASGGGSGGGVEGGALEETQLQVLAELEALAAGGINKEASSGALNFAVSNTAATFDVAAFKSLAFQFTANPAGGGVAWFEGSLEAAGADSWFQLAGANELNESENEASTAGVWFFNVGSLMRFRVRVETAGSGTTAYLATRSTV